MSGYDLPWFAEYNLFIGRLLDEQAGGGLRALMVLPDGQQIELWPGWMIHLPVVHDLEAEAKSGSRCACWKHTGDVLVYQNLTSAPIKLTMDEYERASFLRPAR